MKTGRNILAALGAVALMVYIGLFAGCNWFSSDAKPPRWQDCTKSTNWGGNNASKRYMNMMSFGIPDALAAHAAKKAAAKTAKGKGNGLSALAERVAALEALNGIE